MTAPANVLDLFRLSGRVAIVTGAARGLGKALSIALADAGAHIVALDIGDLDDVASEVRARGVQCELRTTDLCALTPEGARELIRWSQDQLGDVGILVNNAGIIRRGPAMDTPAADWSAVLDLNLTTPFLLSQTFAQPPQAADIPGSVINIGSVNSFQGGYEVPSYAAAKHGLLGMTRALANKWGAHGPGQCDCAGLHGDGADRCAPRGPDQGGEHDAPHPDGSLGNPRRPRRGRRATRLGRVLLRHWHCSVGRRRLVVAVTPAGPGRASSRAEFARPRTPSDRFRRRTHVLGCWPLLRAARTWSRHTSASPTSSSTTSKDGGIPSAKPDAREALRSWLSHRAAGWVRINNATSSDWSTDLRALDELPGLSGVMLANGEFSPPG